MSRLETSGRLILLYLFWEEVCERVRTSGDSTAYSRLFRRRCTHEVRDHTDDTNRESAHQATKRHTNRGNGTSTYVNWSTNPLRFLPNGCVEDLRMVVM